MVTELNSAFSTMKLLAGLTASRNTQASSMAVEMATELI